jgi:hypothetical protein
MKTGDRTGPVDKGRKGNERGALVAGGTPFPFSSFPRFYFERGKRK